MATMSSAAGYQNLPVGNWAPAIYSQKVLKYFRRASVVEAITNTDYTGEIENFGDTVNIIKEPTITVKDYARGQTVNTENLDDNQIQLTIDQGSYFAFKVDDIEERHSHINFESVASSSGAYALKNAYDKNIIAAMFAGAGTTVGSDGSGQDVGTYAEGTTLGTPEIDPINVIANHAKRLDSADVPIDGRWFLASPDFYEELGKANSKLMADTTGAAGPLRNGQVYNGKIHNFTMYQTNNFAASSTSNFFKVLSGHMSSTATANHIAKMEVVRDTESFADVVRGLHVFGRKVLRSEALIAEHIKID